MASDRMQLQQYTISDYCEEIMSLNRKMLQPRGFINESRQSVRYNQFADIKLRIHFDDAKQTMEIETHRYILATKSAYFESLFSKEGGFSEIGALHFDVDEASVIREFFRLFYVPLLEDSQFTENEYVFIVNNVLALHHLAEQFLFHTLRKYCRHKIYTHIDLNLFTLLVNQCLARRHPANEDGDTNQPPFYVIPGRESLFRRAISWFVCCAKVKSGINSGLPFAELEDDHPPSVHINTLTQRANSLIPPPQQNPEKKRKRISESSNRKVEALQCMRQSIVNFDTYDTHSFSLQYEAGRTYIRSFSRICESCARNKGSFHFAVINQVIPESSDLRLKWHIYLDLGEPSQPLSSSLYIKLSNHNCPVRCQTRITPLSKSYKNKVQIGVASILSPRESSFVNLHQFSLNDAESCYEGECEKCHLPQTRLFVIKYEIDATMSPDVNKKTVY